MNLLLRKLVSTGRLLGNPEQFVLRLKKNLLEARSLITCGRPFVYQSVLGLPFACLPEDESSQRHYLEGWKDLVELDVAKAWLKKGDLCCDVGANIGLFCTVFSHCVGPNGRVVALEPSADTFTRLVKTLSLLKLDNVMPLPVAASERAGLVNFFTANANGVSAGENSLSVAPEQRALYRKMFVPAFTVDELFEAMGEQQDCALLKCDAEGSDVLVLRGARQTLQGENPPLVIVEVHVEKLPQFGFTPEDLMALFPATRFYQFIVPHSLRGIHSADLKCGVAYAADVLAEWPFYSNLIAVPKIGRFSVRAASLHVLPLGSTQTPG
jgi:FkbM family methyltransferase